MVLTTIIAGLAVLTFIISQFPKEKKLTKLAIGIIASLILITSIWNGLSTQCQNEKFIEEIAEAKKETNEAKDEIIKYQQETITKILGNADSLWITIEPFYSYKRNMVCYQFKINNGSASGVYDLSIRYHRPDKIKDTIVVTMKTDKYFSEWRVADIGNLPPFGWSYFGKPFLIKKDEVLNYRFHVNSRSGMYYQSTIARRKENYQINEARKMYKFKDIAYAKLAAVDSFIPKKFPIDIYDKKYTW